MYKLSTNLLGRKANSMECKATSRFRFLIWTVIQSNLSINLLSDSSSTWRKLAKAVDVQRCDQLIAYSKLKHLTRVSKLSMN